MFKGKKILLVDDDRDVVELLKIALGHRGVEIVYSYDGADAVKKVYAEKPDLIILDIMMPKFNGWEVLKILKSDEQVKNIPVIMLTTQNLLKDIDKSIELGATFYVTKPLEIERLLRKIEKIFET